MTTPAEDEYGVPAAFGELVATVPYWDERATSWEWDTLIIADSVWPGITRIKTSGRSKKIDTKKSKGGDGATISDDGIEPVKVTLETKLWTAQQFAALQQMLPSVTPTKLGADRASIAVMHPQLALLGITHLYVTRQGTLDIDETGLGTIELEAIEWTPKPAPAKAIGQPAPAGPTAMSTESEWRSGTLNGPYATPESFESDWKKGELNGPYALPDPSEQSNLDDSLSGYAG